MKKYVLLFVAGLLSHSAIADICDHTPSKLIGAGAAASGVTAVAGIGMKVAGYYPITNAITGSAMLGSTAAGTSAAGTVGIMSGTAGAIGTVGGALMSPFVIFPAAIFAGVIGVYEGGCYLASKK